MVWVYTVTEGAVVGASVPSTDDSSHEESKRKRCVVRQRTMTMYVVLVREEAWKLVGNVKCQEAGRKLCVSW